MANGKTIELTKQSAIAKENKNQFVTVCNCLSRIIEMQTSKLPKTPETTNIDKIKMGQFNSLLSNDENLSVRFPWIVTLSNW